MSEGAVHRELLAHLVRQVPGAIAQRDLLRVLDAGRVGPLGMLYAASVEAGCSASVARARAAGCFACFAAGNVADDLADGDCTYLERPHATGPATEFVLLHAAYALWLGPGEVRAASVARAANLLVGGAAQQLTEVRAERFDLATTRDIAAGMGGAQYAAYLLVAWDGTAHEAHAEPIGRAIGNAGFVAEDRRTSDRRYTDLSEEARASLLDWARAHLREVREVALPSTEAVVRYIAPLLEGAP